MSKVKFIPGLFALLRMKKERQARIASAPAEKLPDPISALAKAMHPDELKLTITNIIAENDSVKTYRLQPAKVSSGLPVFLAGQYISVDLTIEGCYTTRAYTISSAPYEAEGTNGYYEISIRKKPGGFASSFIWDNWEKGLVISASGPHGDFFYSPLRDTKEIVALAGGTGITPFRSMMKQFAFRETDMKMTIMYGCKNDCDLLFEKELGDLCQRFPDRLQRFDTFEETDSSDLRQGYIDAGFIRDHLPEPSEKTFFICGPSIMYSFMEKELQKLGSLERKQMRFEVGGTPDNVTLMAGYPSENAGKTINIEVHIGESRTVISAKTTESILVAVEKNGLVLDSCCRSGECGICRSKLISGEVYILPDHDGRRAVDKELGYIHPCSTYPLSDLAIRIPPGKHVKEPPQKQPTLSKS